MCFAFARVGHIELLPTHEVLFVYFFTCALCMMFSVSFFISYASSPPFMSGTMLVMQWQTRNQAQIDVKVSAGVGRGS